LDVFVIMPNHVHGILVILNTNSRGTAVPYPYKEQFGKPVPGSIPTVIRSYKSAVTKKINSICNTKGKSLVWQRDFYEHINRDEESLNNIRQYIQENPLAWEKDLENPRHHPKNHSLLIDIPF
ncbi:MAG: transposase, partial [Prochloron sp. SP5CPC1]|nr:transposase [Candidatus Paraprochloron terpiosi SP5CPC1]